MQEHWSLSLQPKASGVSPGSQSWWVSQLFPFGVLWSGRWRVGVGVGVQAGEGETEALCVLSLLANFDALQPKEFLLIFFDEQIILFTEWHWVKFPLFLTFLYFYYNFDLVSDKVIGLYHIENKAIEVGKKIHIQLIFV